MMDHASQTQVPYDTGWKDILECASIEVLRDDGRLPAHPAFDEEPSGEQTAMVGWAGALCGMTTARCTSATAGQACIPDVGTRSDVESFHDCRRLRGAHQVRELVRAKAKSLNNSRNEGSR
jgi:hypothetical protein